MEFIKQTAMFVVGPALAMYGVFKMIIIYEIRLRNKQAMYLFDMLRKHGKSMVMSEEYTELTLPKTYLAWCALEGMLFQFRIEERMLRAGWSGTDSIANIKIPRWHVNRLKALIDCPDEEQKKINTYILQPWDAQRIGSLKIPEIIPPLYMSDDSYYRIDHELEQVFSGKIDKSGVMLYGDPGNGKTFAIRHFALKHKASIFIVSLSKGLKNEDLIRTFCDLRGPGIVLFEDFDSYFHLRECQIKEPEFTFDVILNVLDGVFSTPQKIVFFMTANDLSKIDPALKNRPSRFKHVLEIGNPDRAMKQKVFGNSNPNILDCTKGFSLDMCLDFKKRLLECDDIDAAISYVKENSKPASPSLFFPIQHEDPKGAQNKPLAIEDYKEGVEVTS